MGVPTIEAILSHLAQEGNVSASTQNLAFNAILFLYRNVLKIELATPIHALRAKRAQHLPTVRSKTEVNQVLSGMQGLHQLKVHLLYGCGLRLMGCMRLCVKEIDFEQSKIVVRQGKGEKERLTMLPVSLAEPLKAQIAFVQKQHTRNLANGYGSVELPLALARNTRIPIKSWPGSISFPPIACPPTPVVALPATITSTPAVYSEQ